MACYSTQDNENWQKRSEKQLTKIMKNMINIAFCRSIKVALYRSVTFTTRYSPDTWVSQVNPRGQSVVLNDSHFCFSNRRERIEYNFSFSVILCMSPF